MVKIAILGPTASGKTALALWLANRFNGVILSLDSLALYKKIDIASAKPTLKERGKIVHFGIDVLYPNEPFNVTLFFELYQEAYDFAKKHNQPLIIVGGTSFYLKAMLEGLSSKPPISAMTKERVQLALKDLNNAQALAWAIDPDFAKKVQKFDRYRLEKWLELFFETGQIPTRYQLRTKQPPIIDKLPIFEVQIERAVLREKIRSRTKKMVQNGLIEEVKFLYKHYGKEPSCMKAIGIKEAIEYLEGRYDLNTLIEQITIHTAQLAKRQQTFNKTQFSSPIIRAPLDQLKDLITPYM